MRRADPEPVDLVAESLGAVVAVAVAARFPGLVRGLVLVSGWADGNDPRHAMVFDTWERLQRQGDGAGFALALSLGPDHLTAMGHRGIAAALAAPAATGTPDRIALGRRVDIRAEARRIRAPTLVVSGLRDALVPTYQARSLAGLITNAKFEMLDCGHAAFAEQGPALAALVERFLAPPQGHRRAG